VLVNNASYDAGDAFLTSEIEPLLGLFRASVEALVALTHQLARRMVARGSGQIINLIPTSALKPGPGLAMQHATRSFFVSFSEALALELKGTGVVVSTQRVRDTLKLAPAPAGSELPTC
jgi:short-subunit dehydrogenase